jgi:hypothetical protein
MVIGLDPIAGIGSYNLLLTDPKYIEDNKLQKFD